ncbi:Mce protein [Mycobacterium sp. Y57]|uniref:Mce protein n=1 Tax=Mycolicibacterium xanthum TaxID=2796469 RepID=UPI001C8505B9|nr:Mce protein [Mycolicibacterium xanthum]MBX7433441.1 Mce protein [Mycolicibacterium xanthum]
MADDAAAPEGELTEPDSAAEETSSGGVEPESSAVEPAGVEDAHPAGEIEDSDDGEATEAVAETEDAEIESDETGSDETGSDETEDADHGRAPMSHVKLALIAGLVAVLALAGLTGWLGFRTYESNRAEAQRNLFLQVGRQGALNLTTISFETADADVQRILDSATGTFYDDFQQRAEPFVEVVKQAQSKSEGTISEAGLESSSDDEAQVLVAVSVRTSNAGAPDQAPRAWRMRLLVQKVDDGAKVANVEFVP